MQISFQNVSFAYESFGAGENQQSNHLQGVTFEIGQPEFVAIIGRSGSGKTTLMHLFNGLYKPIVGAVSVDGDDIHARGYDLARLRAQVGLVFQFPESQLFGMTVHEDIAFGPIQLGLDESDVDNRVNAAIGEVGLPPTFLDRNPLTLSQGEKRKVAIAGILAMRPQVLILDEPTSSLDARSRSEIKRVMTGWFEAGNTVVLISHDADLVAELAQRVIVLHQGSIMFDGTPSQLWDHIDEPDRRQTPEAAEKVIHQAGIATPRTVRLQKHLAETGVAISNFK